VQIPQPLCEFRKLNNINWFNHNKVGHLSNIIGRHVRVSRHHNNLHVRVPLILLERAKYLLTVHVRHVKIEDQKIAKLAELAEAAKKGQVPGFVPPGPGVGPNGPQMPGPKRPMPMPK